MGIFLQRPDKFLFRELYIAFPDPGYFVPDKPHRQELVAAGGPDHGGKSAPQVVAREVPYPGTLHHAFDHLGHTVFPQGSPPAVALLLGPENIIFRVETLDQFL